MTYDNKSRPICTSLPFFLSTSFTRYTVNIKIFNGQSNLEENRENFLKKIRENPTLFYC